MLIYQKINAVMKLVRGVEKASTNKAKGGYKFAGHEAVTEALRDHFATLGIVRSVSMNALNILDGGTVTAHVTVTYTAVEDGSQASFDMFALQPSQTSAKTVEAQQVGQCVSYAVKNIEFKLFALTGDNEADSDTTHNEPSPMRQKAEEREAAEDASEMISNRERAAFLLKQFATATTMADIETTNATIKAEWKTALGSVKGFAESVVAMRTSAIKRVTGVSA